MGEYGDQAEVKTDKQTEEPHLKKKQKPITGSPQTILNPKILLYINYYVLQNFKLNLKILNKIKVKKMILH